MIASKQDFLDYLEADKKALGRKGRFGLRSFFFDPIWRFEILLRKLEYALNCRSPHGLPRLYRMWLWFRLHRLGVKLGFTINPNTFGPGLSIAHYGSIVTSSDMRVGANCRIHSGVNIGAGNDGKVPAIGDNCYIGPGAKLFGGIVIGDNVKFGANAVVNRSFPEGHCTLVGVPARKVSCEEDA